MNDPDFVLEAIKLHPNKYLSFVSNHQELSNNKGFIAEATLVNPSFFKMASQKLQKDLDLITYLAARNVSNLI